MFSHLIALRTAEVLPLSVTRTCTRTSPSKDCENIVRSWSIKSKLGQTAQIKRATADAWPALRRISKDDTLGVASKIK